jgi:hypothetical protein
MLVYASFANWSFSLDSLWFSSGVVLSAILISYITLLVFGLPIAILLQVLDSFRYRFLLPLSLLASSIVWIIFPFGDISMPILFYSSGLIVSCCFKLVFDKFNFN